MDATFSKSSTDFAFSKLNHIPSSSIDLAPNLNLSFISWAVTLFGGMYSPQCVAIPSIVQIANSTTNEPPHLLN